MHDDGDRYHRAALKRIVRLVLTGNFRAEEGHRLADVHVTIIAANHGYNRSSERSYIGNARLACPCERAYLLISIRSIVVGRVAAGKIGEGDI